MPGTLHQGLLEIFKEDPWLPFDVLGLRRPVDGCPIDRRAEIDGDGKQPWTLSQKYPDLVLVHRDADDDKQVRRFAEAHRDNIATDHGGDTVFLARNSWQLNRAVQDWPDLRFLTTREHAR